MDSYTMFSLYRSVSIKRNIDALHTFHIQAVFMFRLVGEGGGLQFRVSLLFAVITNSLMFLAYC